MTTDGTVYYAVYPIGVSTTYDEDKQSIKCTFTNIQQAEKFNTRAQAEQRIMSSCLENCITYGIEE